MSAEPSTARYRRGPPKRECSRWAAISACKANFEGEFMNLFIDTNIFLSFYHLSSADLEELRKLVVLIDQGRLKLYLPSQVVDEFRRNRDNKIADAIKRSLM